MINHVMGTEFEATLPGATPFPAGSTGKSSSGFYIPLVRTLIEEYEKASLGAAFVFTSTAPREGVSVVVANVARELAATTGEKVLIALTSAIGNFAPAQGEVAPEPVIREGNGVFRLRQPSSANSATRVERFELLYQLTRLFPFVLIDAPALTVSAEALEFGARSQGVVLVSAAGQVRRNRLLQTKLLIEFSGAPLLGCALNRRTYPIPNFLYKRL
jgi:Mrp family chromosome partitioning ATPase